MSKERPDFSHHVRRDGNVVIVTLKGHLNGFAAKELKPEIDGIVAEGAVSVVFDCEGLSYTGMYGFQVVVATAKELQRRKRRFAMCDLIPDLKEIFRLLDLTTVSILIFDSLDAALAATKADQE